MIHPDDIIDEFTGGAPRASEWYSLRQALIERRSGLRRQQAGASEPDARAALEAQIAALSRQIKTLETEEVVARFVEDSILVSLAAAPPQTLEDE